MNEYAEQRRYDLEREVRRQRQLVNPKSKFRVQLALWLRLSRSA